MKGVSVLIVDDISDTRDSIRRLLQFEEDIEVLGEAGSGSEAILMAEKLKPDIILMDINMPEMDGIRTTELMALRVPQSSVIIMSVQGEQEYLRRAMVAGAREYIVKPFTGNELANVIAKVYEMDQRKKEVFGEQLKKLDETKPRNGQIISFFSTKGGVGKTTLATNLAVQLASSGKSRVLLVDLNLQFGDVAVFLNLAPKRTIADLTQSGPIKFSEIQSYFLTHTSGLQVLAAPTRPEYAELVTAEQVEQILNEVKSHFDYIICDNVSRFEDVSLVSFDVATQIWLVVAMDVPTLKNAKLSLEVIEGLHHTQKVRVVLNRASKEMGMDTRDVEKSLNSKICYEIPSDGRALVAALNRGMPFVTSYPMSFAAEGIRKMAEVLTNSEDVRKNSLEGKERRSLSSLREFRRVFGF
ncbi:Type II/IV secretion system ATPase TadZ/CpaE, associated with Flp pilus assembly [Desulfosporosinus sp. I2]|uniref:response regulator n=1 Tax=Desulfosporosinus sp. I2 TaxID=1617025 RepID=UPI0005EF9109|nr:response regulator [Desulfosporosinus sp. I2]KJR45862.1 Type II/IV secretion system ATPase TadZ/CpaE, associated with Flp pilus assembly [Desulfosporosinus sp. I2]